jgi:hypothetical protein
LPAGACASAALHNQNAYPGLPTLGWKPSAKFPDSGQSMFVPIGQTTTGKGIKLIFSARFS